MSKWQEDRDVDAYPAKPMPEVKPPGPPHHALCPAMVGDGCQCEARVLKRIVGRKLVEEVVRVMKAQASRRPKLVEDVAMAQLLDKVHELEWKLAEAQAETRRVEEKLAFTQRALDLHTKHRESKCRCLVGDAPSFFCTVHGRGSTP